MHISGPTVWIFIQLAFNACSNWWIPKYKLRCWPLAFTSYKPFFQKKFFSKKKKKKDLELISLPNFLNAFWRKMFLTSYSIKWPKFIVWLSKFIIVIICFPVEDVAKFATNFSFLIKPIFFMAKNVRTHF